MVRPLQTSPGMMKTAALALTSLVATTSLASAAPQDTATKSEDTATTLSLVGGLVSVGALAGGLASEDGTVFLLGLGLSMTAPAWGHYYAEDNWTAGTGMRFAGAGAATIGISMALADAFNEDERDTNRGETGGILVLGGLGLYGAGIIHDIATADDAARAYNNEHQLQAAPLAIKDSAGNTTPGFAVAGRF